MSDYLYRLGVQWLVNQLVSPFRGTITDNCITAPMGKGHGNDCRPFNLETACYLKPLVEAFHNPSTTKVVLMAGVKTLKTFFVEMCCGFHVCHRPGDVTMYFGTGEAAEDHATTRLLTWLKGIPAYKAKLETITGQWDETMKAIKFPDKTMRICPANLTWTQNVNLCFVGVCDAFLTESSGMIDQAIERTTQYPHDKKIVLESQGGETGFDFDRHYRDTDQGELHVNCPCCGMSHVFNWKAFDLEWMTRPNDFKAVVPKDSQKSVDELTQELLTTERRVAGFKRGDESLIKNAAGDYNEQAILNGTCFECFHCGSQWHDDGEHGKTRIALDRSSHYVSARTDALPGSRGFNFPQWINRRIPWGRVMLEKLKRQKLADETGNWEPLKQWWQKYAARTWDKNLSGKSSERPSAEMYTITKEKMEGEKLRVSAVDCQYNLTHLIYLAVAVGDGVPDRVIHYEWIKGATGLSEHEQRESCKARVRELNKELGVQQQNCMLDGGHRVDLVREWAGEDAVFAKGMDSTGRIRPQWFTYGILIGDEKISFLWKHPGRKATWERFQQFHWTNVDAFKDGKRVRIPVHHRLWSNFSIKQIAERWRDGNSAPKLQIHENFLADGSKEGLWAQLNSERLLPWKGRPGKLRYDSEGRPNHAWDAFCMVQVRKDELGLLNQFAAPEAEEG